MDIEAIIEAATDPTPKDLAQLDAEIAATTSRLEILHGLRRVFSSDDPRPAPPNPTKPPGTATRPTRAVTVADVEAALRRLGPASPGDIARAIGPNTSAQKVAYLVKKNPHAFTATGRTKNRIIHLASQPSEAATSQIGLSERIALETLILRVIRSNGTGSPADLAAKVSSMHSRDVTEEEIETVADQSSQLMKVGHRYTLAN